MLAGGSTSANPESRWYAVVRYGSDGEARLTIELYDGNRAGTREESRAATRVARSELEFKERDSPEERWASAGVVVAALVLAQPLDRAPVENQSEAIPVASVKPSEPIRPTPVAPPLVGCAWSWGRPSARKSGARRCAWPLARVALAFADVPVFALASGAYRFKLEAAPTLSWVTGALGAGFRVSFAHERAALEARGKVVIETLGHRGQ